MKYAAIKKDFTGTLTGDNVRDLAIAAMQQDRTPLIFDYEQRRIFVTPSPFWKDQTLRPVGPTYGDDWTISELTQEFRKAAPGIARKYGWEFYKACDDNGFAFN